MSRVFPSNSTTIRGSIAIRWGADGRGYMEVYASAALTALTPYAIQQDEYGAFAEALADNTENYYVGVPEKAYSSGDLAKLYVYGKVSDVVSASDTCTVGHAYHVYDGTIVCTDADYTGNAGEFAVAAETIAVAATTVDLFLTANFIVGTT